MVITSSANPTIKLARSLRERKARQETGLFFLEGLRIVAEAVEKNCVDTLLYAPDILSSPFGHQLIQKAGNSGVHILETSSEVFQTLSAKDGPQGIAAIARQFWGDLQSVVPASSQVWIALDAVADPGNLGTIMRTGDSIGAMGIILLDNCTDPFDPSCVRASMGALFSQVLIKTPFDQFSIWKRANGIPVVGAAGGASNNYHHFSYPDPMVLLMGSERLGLQQHHINICDALVSIPMVGKSDSLNLSIATGVILYELFNQRNDFSGQQIGRPK